MSYAYTPILVDVVYPVLEISLLSKTTKFPFPTMDYMVIKKFNCLELAQKFMQVGIDVTCMHTKFGGRHFSSFGDIAAFKNSQISIFDNGL